MINDGNKTVDPAIKSKNDYFLVSRFGVRNTTSVKKITVGTGLIRVVEPRLGGATSFESVTEDVGSPTGIKRIRDVIVGPEMITVPVTPNQLSNKIFNLFLKIEMTPTFSYGNNSSWLRLGVGEEDYLHPDYNFYIEGVGMGPPEVQVALFKKKYVFPSTMGDTTGVGDDPAVSNYVLQEEFPEEVPENNTEKARNLDSLDSLEIDEDGNIVASAVTYLWIAKVSLTPEGVVGITQKHLGAITWYSPTILYGDFDYRDRSES